jgi:hypothetical protein
MTMEVSPAPHRSPRFVRHRSAKSPLVLQPRDAEIVSIVGQHRVIASTDLQLLVGGSDQGILRRLQKLYHAGFLDRPRSQRAFGNAPLIYALGQRGAALIAEETGGRPVDWSEKNRQLRSHYVEHALAITRFHVALRYAADSLGTVILERWLADGTIRDCGWIEHRDRRERIPVAPDAVFVLNVIDGKNTGRVCAVVEADRGTMTVARFTAKLRGYFAWWRSGAARKRLGVTNFLVATVTRSEDRAAHLRQAAESVSDRGLRMFVFTAENSYLPAARRTVFDPIWRTPADDELHSLLE